MVIGLTGFGRLVGENIAECQPKWSLSIIKYVYFIIKSDHLG